MSNLKHYVSRCAVDALLEASRPALEKRLAAADMITAAQAGALMSARAAEVIAWVARGRAIGLRRAERDLRLPRLQFAPPIWQAVPQLSAALGTTDGWALLGFLETPHGALGGRTPRQAIEQGDAATVVALARHDGN
jgi:hypothetical protein